LTLLTRKDTRFDWTEKQQKAFDQLKAALSFELTSIDICGPYPVSEKGNRYLLTFIDHFTRFPEAVPIPKQDAETVARALLVNMFSRDGCPEF
jgi:hypothetical protein